MKVGIVGCGANSDYHISFAQSYPGVRIVGLVDREKDRAQACGHKHGITNIFTDLAKLVEQEQPDVVHIITPPLTHFVLAKQAIELGRHVLVDKPLALNLDEAQQLYALAERHQVKLCAMHNHNFDPCMAQAHAIIQGGQAGDITGIESHYGVNSRIPAFRDYPAPNVLPWLYNLPYGVYQDFLPHALYVLLDFTGITKEISVMTQSRGVLPWSLQDEIRILIRGDKALGAVTMSFAAQPHLHAIRFHGTKMVLDVDINTMSLITHSVSSLPKAATKAAYNLSAAWQLSMQTCANVINFIRGRLKPYQGMEALIHKFYDSVQHGAECPVSKDQALSVISAIDEIGRHLMTQPPTFDPIFPSSPASRRQGPRVLVTGATGFLGKCLVQRLLQQGYRVRVLARKLSNIERVVSLGAEVFFGDVADKQSLEQAFHEIEVVVHAAAGTSGTAMDSECATLAGTRNILDLCSKLSIRKLVYISSCSVYGVAEYSKHAVVTEESKLEQYPEQRGLYSAAKHAAEDMVRGAMEKKAYPIVVLRPGTIYGPGGELYSPMIGLSLPGKIFIVIGSGAFQLPLTHLENVADATVRSIESDRANFEVFNVVDQEVITKRMYMEQLIRRAFPGATVFYCPYSILWLLVFFQELLCKALGRPPFLTRYRLKSSQNPIRYDSSKLVNLLGWQPVTRFFEAVEKMIT